ncbi:MAG: hypothetical protein ABI321_02230 [Polyangia bacterium]
MGHVYGDSTPFPYDSNFIEQIRKTVDCGVALLQAEVVMREVRERAVSVEQLRKTERTRLAAMSDALTLTMTAFMSSSSERISRGAGRILELARGVVEGEVSSLDGHVIDSQTHGAGVIEHARERVYRAIEAFTLSLDLPHTETRVRLVAGEDTYAGTAAVQTPFGIEAIFSLAIPSAHPWGRPRRVLELSASTEIHLPAETGIFSKRVTLQPFKLDKLFVAEASYGPEKAVITLRKAPRSGSGYEIELLFEEHRVLLRRLGEDGSAEPLSELIELAGEDLVHIERLWNRIHESTADLVERRQAMTASTFDGKNLRANEEPQEILTRLINVVAPVVQEIAQRSGAPGELVLRRDVGQGRREEIFITKAELHEKVETLPEAVRAFFDPLELSEGPRSPRAPAPSAQIYLDVDPTNVGDDDLDLESKLR